MYTTAAVIVFLLFVFCVFRLSFMFDNHVKSVTKSRYSGPYADALRANDVRCAKPPPQLDDERTLDLWGRDYDHWLIIAAQKLKRYWPSMKARDAKRLIQDHLWGVQFGCDDYDWSDEAMDDLITEIVSEYGESMANE